MPFFQLLFHFSLPPREGRFYKLGLRWGIFETGKQVPTRDTYKQGDPKKDVFMHLAKQGQNLVT